ncbi:uncharacterized protein LOC144621537 isoform X3 [Crassostrea virginica]
MLYLEHARHDKELSLRNSAQCQADAQCLQPFNCHDCPAGFYGPRCNVTCSFPNFGQYCQGLCNCLKDRCDYIYGCKIGVDNWSNGSETIPPSSSTDKTGGFKDDIKFRTSILIYVAGTFISSLLVVVLGFQLQSRITCRKDKNHQQQMVCEEENIYAEVRK